MVMNRVKAHCSKWPFSPYLHVLIEQLHTEFDLLDGAQMSRGIAVQISELLLTPDRNQILVSKRQ